MNIRQLMNKWFFDFVDYIYDIPLDVIINKNADTYDHMYEIYKYGTQYLLKDLNQV